MVEKIDIYSTIASNSRNWFDSNWVYVFTSIGFLLFSLTLVLWWVVEMFVSLDETGAPSIEAEASA